MVKTKNYLLKSVMLVIMLAALVFPASAFADAAPTDGGTATVTITDPGKVTVNTMVTMEAKVKTDYVGDTHIDWSVTDSNADISQHKGEFSAKAVGVYDVKATVRTGAAQSGTGGGGGKQATDCTGTVLGETTIKVNVEDSVEYGFQGDKGNTLKMLNLADVTVTGIEKRDDGLNVYNNKIGNPVKLTDGTATFEYTMSKGMNNPVPENFDKYKDQIKILAKDGTATKAEIQLEKMVPTSTEVPEGMIVIQAKGLDADTAYTLQFGPEIYGNNNTTTLGAYIEFAFKTAPAEVVKLDTVTGVKATSASYNSVKISWKPVTEATEYHVYRASSAKGTLSQIGKADTTSYVDKSLKTGTKYYYTVRACKVVDGKEVSSDDSARVSAMAKLGTPTLKVSAGKSEATLKWSPVAGKSGYQVYRATSLKGKYTKVTTTTKTSTVDKKVNSKKTYYYKVRAYKNVSGKAVPGSCSSIIKVKIK